MGLAPDGTLQAVFRSGTGGATVDVIFDVTGYFLPDSAGATYHTTSMPGRILDTRPDGPDWKHIGLLGKFKNRVVRTISVAGVVGINWTTAEIPLGATAVTGNVTVTNASSDGYVALGPTMTNSPKTSIVNTKAKKNTANGFTVQLSGGTMQAVWMGTTGSSADVIIDITGYFTADASGLKFYPVLPYRVLDSSSGRGLSGAFATGTVRALTVGGSGGTAGVPTTARGIAGNLTVVAPTSSGYAFAAPSITPPPKSSTVNTNRGATAANGLDVALASNEMALIWWGATGSTAHLVLDINGYWQ
jgi:hypothetical protein